MFFLVIFFLIFLTPRQLMSQLNAAASIFPPFLALILSTPSPVILVHVKLTRCFSPYNLVPKDFLATETEESPSHKLDAQLPPSKLFTKAENRKNIFFFDSYTFCRIRLIVSFAFLQILLLLPSRFRYTVLTTSSGQRVLPPCSTPFDINPINIFTVRHNSPFKAFIFLLRWPRISHPLLFAFGTM